MIYSEQTIAELYGLVDPKWSDEIVRLDGKDVFKLTVAGKREDGELFEASIGASGEDNDMCRRRCMSALKLDALSYAARTTRIEIGGKLHPIARDEVVAAA